MTRLSARNAVSETVSSIKTPRVIYDKRCMRTRGTECVIYYRYIRHATRHVCNTLSRLCHYGTRCWIVINIPQVQTAEFTINRAQAEPQ